MNASSVSSRIRGRFAVAVALATVLATLVASPVAAVAGNGPCGNVDPPGNFRGGVKADAGTAGVTATIEYVNTPLCTNVGNANDDLKGSHSWVGIYSDTPTQNGSDIFQAGLSKCKDPGNLT